MRIHPLLLSSLLLTLACGSSSSNIASGGVGGSGVSKGPVSAKGSIFVTGTHWEIDAITQIEINGEPGDEADLFLGMVVTVEGTVDAGGMSGIADNVSFDDDLEGPIATISDVGNDGVAKTLDILGVEVLVEDGVTVFDNFDFDTMMVGDVVEVSGLRDAEGDIRATRVEFKGVLELGVTQVELKGTVEGLADSSFQLGSITVNFDPLGATTDLTKIEDGPLADGRFVEVEGTIEMTGEITATSIETEDDEDDDLPDVDDGEIEGVITRFVSLSDLDVAGQPVDASGATLVPDDPALYHLNVLVEVEGPIVGGVLMAEKLELRGFDVRIEAAIADPGDIDVAAGTVVLLGIPVQTDQSTQLEDKLLETPGFSLADLAAGDFLVVRGVEDPPRTLRATRLERSEPDDIKLRGFLEDEDEGAETLTVLGQVIDVSLATFEDDNDLEIMQGQFFAQVMPGDLVEVRDRQDGDDATIDMADDVEIETPEAGSPGLPPSFFPGVPPITQQPSLAAALEDLGLFDAPPADELERLDELVFDTGAETIDRTAAFAPGEPGDEQPSALRELSMVDAVRLFFDRIREVAASGETTVPSASSGD
ncbi:MAG: DUF5666 domain-containing protein [Myxococcota bacterium]|nr:DUF5666 domain-containing protein [Myxococcota bacterium]